MEKLVTMLLTLSDPARSTKWNFETTVTHSPESSPPPVDFSLVWPRALDGLSPPLPIAAAKLGVEGRPPRVGEEALPLGLYTELGRASLEGDLPPGGRGEEERGGTFREPVYFF